MTEQRGSEVGHGGRSSDKGVKVAVFGGSGFLGKYVGSELGKSMFKPADGRLLHSRAS